MSDPIDTLRRVIAEAEEKRGQTPADAILRPPAYYSGVIDGLREALKVLEKNDG